MCLEVVACVVIGVLCVAALGGLAYNVYLDSSKKHKPHGYGGSDKPHGYGGSGSGNDPGPTFVCKDEVITSASVGDSEIRHRPTGKTCEGNIAVENKQNQANEMSEELTSQKIPTSDEKISALEKQIADLLKEIEKEKIEKQNQLNNTVSNSDKVQEWLETNQVPQNGIHDDDDSSVDSTDTVRSFDSTNSKVVKKPKKEVQKIPIWDEMSDNDKRKKQCLGCENGCVETVAHPCKHSYMCLKCAYEIFQHHKYCSLCNVKIDSYKRVTA